MRLQPARTRYRRRPRRRRHTRRRPRRPAPRTATTTRTATRRAPQRVRKIVPRCPAREQPADGLPLSERATLTLALALSPSVRLSVRRRRGCGRVLRLRRGRRLGLRLPRLEALAQARVAGIDRPRGGVHDVLGVSLDHGHHRLEAVEGAGLVGARQQASQIAAQHLANRGAGIGAKQPPGRLPDRAEVQPRRRARDLVSFSTTTTTSCTYLLLL